MTNERQHLLVLSSCPGPDSAEKIANELVTNRLAACVQILPHIQSCFRWQKKVDHAEEQLLLIKTTLQRYPDLENKIKSMHPYELPEIIAVPISTGLQDYLSWIEDCTLSA
ncbi:MAG: divalent-cation tolerance protein CutA [Gammaproteobacteria bacterium]